MPAVDKTHFQNAKARRLNKSLGDVAGLTGLGVHWIEIPPGSMSSEHHQHHQEEKCLFVLEGEGISVIGDSEQRIVAGDFVADPAGCEAHHVRNESDEPLRCLVIGNRLDYDVCDYPRLGRRLFRNKDLSWNLVDLSGIESIDR